MIIPNKESRTA